MLSPSRQDEEQAVTERPCDAAEHKVRCLCGKWWCYRSGERLVLRCKLCRRDIVITGDNLKISYR
jgi:hypothetical protein